MSTTEPTYVFVRFHARAGCEAAIEGAMKKMLEPVRREAGCLSIHAFRSIREDRLFYVHSTWQDAAAFELHAQLPHTVAFIDEVTPLIDHPVQAVRTRRLG